MTNNSDIYSYYAYRVAASVFKYVGPTRIDDLNFIVNMAKSRGLGEVIGVHEYYHGKVIRKLGETTLAASLSRDYFIAPKGFHLTRRLIPIFRLIFPGWFTAQFGPDILEDLIDVAKEHGGRTWWIIVGLEAFKLVLRFGARRFHRCKHRESASSHTQDRE